MLWPRAPQGHTQTLVRAREKNAAKFSLSQCPLRKQAHCEYAHSPAFPSVRKSGRKSLPYLFVVLWEEERAEEEACTLHKHSERERLKETIKQNSICVDGGFADDCSILLRTLIQIDSPVAP